MKKFLLSMALIGAMASANATIYTIYDANGTWEENTATNGYKCEQTVNGKTFTIITDKNKYNNSLLKPDAHIRVYKNSQLKVESAEVEMKGIRLTCVNNKSYNFNVDLSTGWTGGTMTDYVINGTSSGLNDVTITASNGQVRVLKIEVSDTEGELGSVPEPVYTEVNSVAETIALPSNSLVKVNYDLTVGFVNYSNIYAVDAAGDFIQIYNQNTYKIGDKIPAGWSCQYSFYSNTTPELTNAVALPDATEGTFTPLEADPFALTTADVNRVVLFKNVVFDEDTPADKANFTGTVNGETVNLRNNYTLESVAAGTYDVTVVVTVYQNAPNFYVVNYAEATQVDYPTLYLVGESFGNWSVDEACKFTREGNVYTITLADGISGTWKIWDGTWNYNFGAGDQPKVNEPTNVWFNSPTNFGLNTIGETKVTFTLVEGSDVQNSSIPSTLLVEGEAANVELSYGIKGTIFDGTWDITVDMLEGDNREWSWTGEIIPGDFGIVELANGGQNAWYSADGDNAIAENGTFLAKVNGTNWSSSLEGKYTFTFNPETLQLTITGGTGVAAIEADSAEVVYYNLQGVRVAQPETGLYIMVKGNKAEKVMLSK